MYLEYQNKSLQFVKIDSWRNLTIYIFKHEKEIILLFKRNGKWQLNWGTSPKKKGKNYEWFDKNEKDRCIEGEKFANFLFEFSNLRLHFLFQNKS